MWPQVQAVGQRTAQQLASAVLSQHVAYQVQITLYRIQLRSVACSHCRDSNICLVIAQPLPPYMKARFLLELLPG